jgi:hypothetical protein
MSFMTVIAAWVAVLYLLSLFPAEADDTLSGFMKYLL